MKLVAAMKMLPTPEQAALLSATLERCNAACSYVAAKGFATGTFRQFALHKAFYRDIRGRFGLTAQAAVRCIAKVADAFKINKSVAPVFRPDAAQPYDERIIRFGKDCASASIWTLDGRIHVALAVGEHQRAILAYRKGEVDLCLIRGKWILAATCDVPETDQFEAEDWLGVDFGIVNIACDSDGRIYSGADVERGRAKFSRRRAGLQRRGTKAAKRRLRKISGKQARYQRHTNHCISRALVETAQRTGRGIAVEELTGIRDRVTARRGQRARLSNWAFAQLRSFVEYKAKRAGVPHMAVDPRNTSRECPCCGCINKRNRKSQSTFSCVSCGHTAPADPNAAVNIRSRALTARATATMPDVLAA
jgi:putative transposase